MTAYFFSQNVSEKRLKILNENVASEIRGPLTDQKENAQRIQKLNES